MLWFQRSKRREIWEEEIPAGGGDLGMAKRIRDICNSAADSAESVGRTNTKNHAQRYDRAKKHALELVMKIRDDLMRDAAVRQVVNLCMKANDMRIAEILIRAVQEDQIKDEIYVDHPSLRQ